ncbi:hypothetical protein NE237_003782 [Protea cynaroides]|uniref:Uncharacterized protein n=1 Tax=Protea cynaroides TaxID=273540 RepID=A0A9Q0KHE2_9MAGN|nr:hypothetical protein NE237_003782 [Protea cynaroides]
MESSTPFSLSRNIDSLISEPSVIPFLHHKSSVDPIVTKPNAVRTQLDKVSHSPFSVVLSLNGSSMGAEQRVSSTKGSAIVHHVTDDECALTMCVDAVSNAESVQPVQQSLQHRHATIIGLTPTPNLSSSPCVELNIVLQPTIMPLGSTVSQAPHFGPVQSIVGHASPVPFNVSHVSPVQSKYGHAHPVQYDDVHSGSVQSDFVPTDGDRPISGPVQTSSVVTEGNDASSSSVQPSNFTSNGTFSTTLSPVPHSMVTG